MARQPPNSLRDAPHRLAVSAKAENGDYWVPEEGASEGLNAILNEDLNVAKAVLAFDPSRERLLGSSRCGIPHQYVIFIALKRIVLSCSDAL